MKRTLLFFALAALGNTWGATDSLCGKVLLVSETGIGFTDNELSLICGDPSIDAWTNVTDTQSLFHLRTFLQQRGYNHPTSSRQGKVIRVDAGRLSFVTSLEVINPPPELDIDTFRHIENEVLTPSFLDKLEERFRAALQTLGYGCPQIKSQANPDNGSVVVTLEAGVPQNIVDLKMEPVEGFNVHMLGRYHAFLMNERFNSRLLRVTENRITSSQLFQSTNFSVNCNKDGIYLRQSNTSGAPRLFVFGFGLNTERGPTAKASWKHVRLFDTGSNLEFSLMGSFKIQEFVIKSDWYFLPTPSRLHLHPALSIRRENVATFERYVGQLQLSPAINWDNQYVGLNFSIGPSLNFERLVRGTGAREVQFLSVQSELRLESHDHEFFRNSPQTGFDFGLKANLTQNNVLSNLTAQLLRFDYEYLWNVASYDPPAVIIGIRGALATTITNESSRTSRVLPTNFKHYLGGSQDLRGFELRTLPGEQGALTAAYSSLEVRLPDLLAYKLQPLIFTDFGVLGQKSMSLKSPVYFSPGLGVRWESPIGVFRSTLANGYISDQSYPLFSHWRFYISLGEEF